MPRPQVTVTVTEELARRGSPSGTGTALWAFTAAQPTAPGARTSTTDPVVVRSAAEAAAAFPEAGAANVIAWVGDALTTAGNVGTIVLVRAEGAAAELTEAEWTATLDKLGEDFGPGQVAIPGVVTAAAAAAITGHVASHPYRAGLVDAAADVDAEDLIALSASLADSPGAPRTGVVAPWVTVSAPAGTSRAVPASVLVSGLVARNDAAVGHANNAPAVDQGRSAGVIRQGLGVTRTYTDAERDDLNDGGVSVIRLRQGVPTLYGWRSVSTDEVFRQLSAGRMVMQLDATFGSLLEQFVERQIDGRGALYSEVDTVLRAELTRLWSVDALYGATADDAFTLAVADVNSTTDAAAGLVKASASVKLTRSAERVDLGVSVTTAEGSLAA